MANSLGGFSRRIRSLADRAPRNAARIVREAALAIDQAVVLATPVDTGRARSNWIVSSGFANTRETEAYSPGDGLGKGEGANAAAAIAQGKAAISRARDGQDIYIQNNLPYISILNQGSSAQAPSNFVEKAAIAGSRAVRKGGILK